MSLGARGRGVRCEVTGLLQLGMGLRSEHASEALRVGLFPLPNVVLFPRAVLPLHIFEERYKAMTADALEGSRQIAMALYRTGWEQQYHGRAPVEPVVCVGTILSHEKLLDGRYNFLLQGQTRARIVREIQCDRPYRLVELEALEENRPLEIDLETERAKLRKMFGCGAIGQTRLGEQFGKLLASPMTTVDLADLIAFNLLDDVSLKQSLLAELDGARRVRRVMEEMGRVVPMLAAKLHARGAGAGAVNLN